MGDSPTLRQPQSTLSSQCSSSAFRDCIAGRCSPSSRCHEEHEGHEAFDKTELRVLRVRRGFVMRRCRDTELETALGFRSAAIARDRFDRLDIDAVHAAREAVLGAALPRRAGRGEASGDLHALRNVVAQLLLVSFECVACRRLRRETPLGSPGRPTACPARPSTCQARAPAGGPSPAASRFPFAGGVHIKRRDRFPP